jgi:FkbM family methyltransferase
MDAGVCSSTIYSTPNLHIVARNPGASSFLVVTFESLVDPHEPPRQGFAESFLAANGIDAVHVIGHSNAWYQYPEMPGALAAIRAVGQRYAEIVTYGLSMGGYAAINFAAELGAARAIAISPQYSIDPRKVPFETRWNEYVPPIRFICDQIDRLAGCPVQVWAIYDPENLDHRHVARIAEWLTVHSVLVPFSGHPATSLLSETRMFSTLVLDLLHRRHDPETFASRLAKASPQTAAWYAGRAEALPRHDKRRKLPLYRQAAAIRPNDPRIARDLGFVLHMLRARKEAVEALQHAWSLDPPRAKLPFMLSQALSRCGHHQRAVAAAEAAVRLDGTEALFTANLATMRRRLNRQRQRTAFVRRATAWLHLAFHALLGWRWQPPGLLSLKMLRNIPREAREAAIRRLCATVPMAGGIILCRVLGRYKMLVDDTDLGLGPHLMLEGFWESWVTEVVLAYARPGMVAVDAGANVGYFTLLMADCAGDHGHVHAFEPNPRMRDLAQRSAAMNGLDRRITMHAGPLGARSGEQVRLIIPDNQPMNAHLAPAAMDDPEALQTIALDDALACGRVDLVKIDAEGAEYAIWRGMQAIVARGEPMTILLEFTPERIADPAGFLAELAAAGFGLARIDPRHGVVPVSAQAVLDAPASVDQMLALTRPAH